MFRSLLVAAAASLAVGALFVSPFAGSVYEVVPGAGAQYGAPGDALGEPQAEGDLAGSFDVYTLGVNGSLAVEMSVPMFDGPGADLIVYENAFFLPGTQKSFSEAMHVEVSSDGETWARFPSTYHGDPGPFSPFAACPVEWYEGLAGVMPCSGGSVLGVDPLNVVQGGGDAFDFEWLADDPGVVSGEVDLQVVRYVRLLDVGPGGVDSAGTRIYDHGLDAQASADVDALIGVNDGVNGGTPGRPEVEVTLTDAGLLTIRVSDPDGLADVKFGLKASINGAPFDFYQLLSLFVIVPIDADTVEFVTGPVPSGVFDAVLKVGAVDGAGLTRGDVVHIH